MLNLRIEPEYQTIPVTPRTTLLEVSEDHDIGVIFGCRQGACGSCLIGVEPGCQGFESPSIEESDFLESLKAAPNQRLACCCTIIGNAAISADADYPFPEKKESRA